MNRSLLASTLHLPIAAAVAIGFTAWLKMKGYSVGSREGSDANYVLWSGWVAAILMYIAAAYALRKYIHRLGWSFETKNRVGIKNLERAEARISDIRRGVARGMFSSAKEVRAVCNRILKEEKVTKAVNVVVTETKEDPKKKYEIELFKNQPLGRVFKWMHAHIFYGLASWLLVYLHGGNSLQSPMGQWLNGLTWAVMATGVLGLFLWLFGPRWMTKAEGEICFEKRFVLNEHYEQQMATVDEELAKKTGAAYKTKLETALRAKICAAKGTKPDPKAPEPIPDDEAGKIAMQVKEFESTLDRLKSNFKSLRTARVRVDGQISEALAPAATLEPDVRTLFEDMAVLVCQRSRFISSLAALNRLKWITNIWRAVHIPASIVLLVVIVVHIISVWWY